VGGLSLLVGLELGDRLLGLGLDGLGTDLVRDSSATVVPPLQEAALTAPGLLGGRTQGPGELRTRSKGGRKSRLRRGASRAGTWARPGLDKGSDG